MSQVSDGFCDAVKIHHLMDEFHVDDSASLGNRTFASWAGFALDVLTGVFVFRLRWLHRLFTARNAANHAWNHRCFQIVGIFKDQVEVLPEKFTFSAMSAECWSRKWP